MFTLLYFIVTIPIVIPNGNRSSSSQQIQKSNDDILCELTNSTIFSSKMQVYWHSEHLIDYELVSDKTDQLFDFKCKSNSIQILIEMYNYKYTSAPKACSASTIGDTCATGCCLETTGPSMLSHQACAPSSLCQSTPPLTSTQTFKYCLIDEYSNVCSEFCCSTLESTSINATICSKGYQCEGINMQAILVKADKDNIKDIIQIEQKSVTKSGEIIIAVNVTVFIILIGIFVWMICKLRKIVMEKDQLQRQVGQNPQGFIQNPQYVAQSGQIYGNTVNPPMGQINYPSLGPNEVNPVII